jgi:hypothetical protein
MKKKFLIILHVIGLSMLVLSCSKKPDIGYTPTYKMAGEWFIELFEDGSQASDFHKIISYNTSDPNSNQVWVDDLNLWPFKSKLNIDYQNLAFTPMDSAPNIKETGETVKVIEGKVIPQGGHSKAGNIVDSIYLKIEFSDDPGTIYELKGHARTGFLEDEY